MVQAEKKVLAVLAIAIIIVFAVIVNLPHSDSGSSGHEPFVITSDSEFTEENGVVSGSGMSDDPYVIEGWTISAAIVDEYANVPIGIHIKDTTAHFIIRDVVIEAPDGHDGPGIYMMRASNGAVENCTANDLYVSCYYSTDITVKDCVVNAIWLTECTAMSVRDCEIVAGLKAYDSVAVELSGNSIGGDGIELYKGQRVDISWNSLDGEDAGILLSSCYSCNVSGNSMTDVGLKFIGNRLYHFDSHNISKTNTVSGMMVESHKGEAVVQITGSNLWQVIVLDCGSVQMTDVSIDGPASPIVVTSASWLEISDCTIANGETGVLLIECSNVSITGSSVYSQADAGIRLIGCVEGEIFDNSIYSNGPYGAWHTYGYWEDGWSMPGGYGLALVSCSGFVTTHNTFMANALGGYDNNPGANLWSLGYEEGGNYWGQVPDLYCGPGQDIPGPDGVGDDEIRMWGGEYPTWASDEYPSAVPFSQITLPEPQDENAAEDDATTDAICLATVAMAIVIVVVLYVLSRRGGKDDGGT